jgi:hypothetical protein
MADFMNLASFLAAKKNPDQPYIQTDGNGGMAASATLPQNNMMKNILGLLGQYSGLNDDAGRKFLEAQGAPTQATPEQVYRAGTERVATAEAIKQTAPKSEYNNSQWWLGSPQNQMPAIKNIKWDMGGGMVGTVDLQSMHEKDALLKEKIEDMRVRRQMMMRKATQSKQ